MHGMGVSTSDSQSHFHSHQDLDSVTEMVATAASVTVSNIIGMIGTETGLKVQWCIFLIDALLTSLQAYKLFPSLFFLLA
jgi:hypothetical protein